MHPPEAPYAFGGKSLKPFAKVKMLLPTFITLLLSSRSLAAILEARQAQSCFQDDCLRAINGTRRGPNFPSTGTSNCRDFLTTSFLVDPTYVFPSYK